MQITKTSNWQSSTRSNNGSPGKTLISVRSLLWSNSLADKALQYAALKHNVPAEI